MQQLVKLLQSISPEKHTTRVFEDFITIAAISLHNRAIFDKAREDEYLQIIHTYKKLDQSKLAECFALLVNLLEPKPRDILGQVYMELGLGNSHLGQYYTPDPISQLMSKLTLGDVTKTLEGKPFITVSEPAAGSGAMLLAIVNELISKQYNPASVLWVQATDVSRVASLMCYVQLSLWNVPAQVIVGNSLTLELRELWHTPAHVLFGWQQRLKHHAAIEKFKEITSPDNQEQAEQKEKREVLFAKPKIVNADVHPPKTKKDVAEAVQIGFDFG